MVFYSPWRSIFRSRRKNETYVLCGSFKNYTSTTVIANGIFKTKERILKKGTKGFRFKVLNKKS